MLRSRLTVNVNKDNFVFTVSLVDEDRLRAQRGLQAVLDAYFSEQEDRAGTRANSGLSFLENQVAKARRAADASRAEEQAFKRAHDILSTDPEENLHARTLRDLSLKRTDLGQRLAASSALVGLVKEAEKAGTPEQVRANLLRIDQIGTNVLVQKVQEQLFQAQAEAQSLTPRYGPKHPRMKEAQLAITARTQELDQAIDTAREDILETYQQLLLESQSLDKEIATESAALEHYRADLNRLQGLSQKTKQDADLLDDLMRQQREGSVLARLDAKQVVVNSPPSPATGPVNVHLFRSLVMALFLGSMAAVGAAFAAELLNRTVTGVARARELSGLPLLGELPSAGEALRPLAGSDPESEPELSAAVRAVRENLILSAPRVPGGRCLVLTSPMPNEGKTSIAARLAVSLGAAGAKVLLIDADMRHPSLDAQMGCATPAGFAALLGGGEVQPTATAYHHVDYLGVGVEPANPSELLYSPVLGQWLAEARQYYDFILFDSAPLVVTDPLILSEQADGVLLILRDRHTTKTALHEAMLSLAPVRDRVIGFILNDAQEERARARYYYYGYTARAAGAAQATTQRSA